MAASTSAAATISPASRRPGTALRQPRRPEPCRPAFWAICFGRAAGPSARSWRRQSAPSTR
eukprot:9059126-Alexandrium_andersonii.AAC.1